MQRGLTPLSNLRGLTPLNMLRGLTPLSRLRGLLPLSFLRGLLPQAKGSYAGEWLSKGSYALCLLYASIASSGTVATLPPPVTARFRAMEGKGSHRSHHGLEP